MARKLFVGNLPFTTSEEDLHTLFAGHGEVESVNLMRDPATGRARGFAFVEMATEEAAQAAIQALADYSLEGRTLTVNEARPKTSSGGGGGGRGGSGSGGGGGRRDRPRRSEPRW